MPDPMENGAKGDERPLHERAAEAAGLTVNADDIDSLFPDGYLDGDAWTLAKVHKSGLPVNVKASLSKSEVPIRSGLPDPGKRGRAVISYGRPSYHVKPAYEKGETDGDDFNEFNVVANLKVSHVEPIGSTEDFLLREFERFVDTDRQAAAALADALVRIANGEEVAS